MNGGCHLYAINADRIEQLKLNPALVLGQCLLSGGTSCHLENSCQTLHGLLCGEATETPTPSGFLVLGGYPLSEGDAEWTNPRLLLPRDVSAFHNALRVLSDAELFRRFNRQAMIAAGMDSMQLFDGGWCTDCAEEDEGSEDDWTLDQAEEFEQLARDVELLRAFLLRAEANGQGAVVIWG